MDRDETLKDVKLSPNKLLSPAIVKTSPDMLFAVLTAALILIGCVMLFSAGSDYAAKTQNGDSFYYLREHIMHIGIGLLGIVFCILFLGVRSSRWMTIAVHGIAILLLVAVLLFGRSAGGAKRWLNFGGLSVQPSEVAKTTLIMFVALYMSVMEDKIYDGKWYHSCLYGFVIPVFGIVAPICVLVAAEKHLSGTIIVFLVGIVTILFGGVPMKWVLKTIPIVGVPALIGYAFWEKIFALLPKYVRGRLDSWVNRGADALGSDWQSTQGLYAIGTGGMFGLGLGESRLKYGYVSQPQNDFVFTIICEELGFFGAISILLLFLALFARGMVLAIRCQDKFCGTVIAGLSFKIILHVLFNVAVVTGVFPNTGISLPFFSSGGSATIIQMADAGIILAFSKYCKTES